jgi:hypothetical protein
VFASIGGRHVERRCARQIFAEPATVLKDADFNWEDPLGLEAELTEEKRMARDSARAFGHPPPS